MLMKMRNSRGTNLKNVVCEPFDNILFQGAKGTFRPRWETMPSRGQSSVTLHSALISATTVSSGGAVCCAPRRQRISLLKT